MVSHAETLPQQRRCGTAPFLRTVPHMSVFRPKPAAAPRPADGNHLPHLRIELGLQLADNDAPLAEKIALAAAAAGGDLLFVLPAPDGQGVTAMVRLTEAGADRYVQVRTSETGLAVSEEAEVDPAFAQFARSAAALLRCLSADRGRRTPLAAAT